MSVVPALQLTLQALQIAGPLLLEILQAIVNAKAQHGSPDEIRAAVITALLQPNGSTAPTTAASLSPSRP